MYLCFSPFKYWHQKAIKHVIRSLDIDYNVGLFLRDLTEIRRNTFRIGTVKKAWREAGLYPINCKIALTRMRYYAKSDIEERLPPLLPPTPRKFGQSEDGLQYWKEKIPDLLSSPSRKKWDSWTRGTEILLAGGHIKEMQYDQLLEFI